MGAYRATSGVVGMAAALAIAGCSSSLPSSGTGTGGAGALGPKGFGGVGGLALTGTGGAGGLAPMGGGGSSLTGRVPQIHRATAMACSAALAEAGVPTSIFDGSSPGPVALDGGLIDCASDSDCPPCQNGQRDRCISAPQYLRGPWCICDECTSDQDCGPNAVCVCNAPGFSNTMLANECIQSQCQVDSDCGPGGFCSPTPSHCGLTGYYCHTSADQCFDNTDCPGGGPCLYSLAAGVWTCSSNSCGGG
jgi:hypothetical protein